MRIPITNLPHDIQGAVDAAHVLYGTPPELSVPILLSGASFAAQTFVDVDTVDFGKKPTSLYFMVLATSGNGKSTAAKIVEKPYDHVMSAALIAYKKAMSDYKIDKMVWDSDMKKATGAKRSSTRDQEIDNLKRVEPEPPINPRRKVEKFTPKGLEKQLTNGHPSAWCFTAEGINFLGSHANQASNNMQGELIGLMTNLWDGSPISRTTGDDPLEAEGCRLSTAIITQPTVAADFLNSPYLDGQGILARFLVSNCPDFKPPMIDDSPSAVARKDNAKRQLELYQDRLATLLSKPYRHQPDDEHKLICDTITMDQGARDRMKDWYNQTVRPKIGQSPLRNRQYEQALRIAAVLAFWNDQKMINVANCVAAIELMEYFCTTIEEIDLVGAAPQDSRHKQYIQATVRMMNNFKSEGKDTASRTDFNSRLRWYKEADAGVREAVIQSMIADGIIEAGEEVTGTRTKEVFRLAA